MFRRNLILIIGIVTLAITACDNSSDSSPPPASAPAPNPTPTPPSGGGQNQNQACTTFNCLEVKVNGDNSVRRLSEDECNKNNCSTQLSATHAARAYSSYQTSVTLSTSQRGAPAHTMRFRELPQRQQDLYQQSFGTISDDLRIVGWACFNQSDIDAGLAGARQVLDSEHMK